MVEEAAVAAELDEPEEQDSEAAVQVAEEPVQVPVVEGNSDEYENWSPFWHLT